MGKQTQKKQNETEKEIMKILHTKQKLQVPLYFCQIIHQIGQIVFMKKFEVKML